MSPRAAWERTLVPHLDDLPFQFVGKGEQNSLKIMLALAKKADASHVILVEEPENHLSFSSLNMIMDKVGDVDRELHAGHPVTSGGQGSWGSSTRSASNCWTRRAMSSRIGRTA
ncbi:MAG TPA: hypothetical protein VEH31_12070, partial [Streptosporangiaceae bacterium]|nr:hypothetical protein [Streptosporangiaceae bacterium]